MSQELLKDFFCWCSLINVSVLIVWSLATVCCRDFVFRINNRFTGVSKEQFTNANYLLIGFFKIAVLIFNVIPLVALMILSN